MLNATFPLENDQITNRTLFYNLLKEYLMTAGGSYEGDVVYAANSTNNTLILVNTIPEQ